MFLNLVHFKENKYIITYHGNHLKYTQQKKKFCFGEKYIKRRTMGDDLAAMDGIIVDPGAVHNASTAMEMAM